ncbi:hypothetical protein BH11BAC1_BH11BAC1_00720 [soil metagenome]
MKKSFLIILILWSIFAKADYWTQMANFPGPGRQVPTSFVINNIGYVGCGLGAGYMNDFWSYDPVSNSWAQVASLPGPGRYGGAGFAMNGKGYVCTGGSSVLSDFWEYDPVTNSWLQLPNFPGPARERSVGFSIGNKGYMGCGDPGHMSDFWEWDQATTLWTQKTSLSIGRVAPVGFSIAGKGYVTTGYGNLPLYDLWEFDTLTNAWTQKADLPAPGRIDASAFSICDKGFVGTGGESPFYDDFWEFIPTLNQWIQKANVPGGVRDDCAYFSIGTKGYIGLGQFAGSTYAFDFWEYTPDSITCFLSAIFSAPNNICPGTCVNFNNTSVNATAFQWTFPGATPSSSTDLNPVNICYPNSGNYDVQLIASNINGSDTLLLTNYITVYPSPLPQGIIQSGDTLFANPGATSYQWYFNGMLIPGATGYFYLATASGDYNVVATDLNGCEVEAAIFNVLAGTSSEVSVLKFEVYPNPVGDKLIIQKSEVKNETAFEISVYNVLGEKMSTEIPSATLRLLYSEIDVRGFTPGLYYLEIITPGKSLRTKFVKQ